MRGVSMDWFIGVISAIITVAVAFLVFDTALTVTKNHIVHDCKNYGKYEYQTDKWIKCEVDK